MLVRGFTIKPQDPAACAVAFRFYGTRETVTADDGAERPHPNRWQLVCEVRAVRDGPLYTLPDFNLPRTEPGRWRYFYPVPVMPDGRELWHADGEIVLPRAAINALGGSVNFAGLILYNLELKGVIAPGQLLD